MLTLASSKASCRHSLCSHDRRVMAIFHHRRRPLYSLHDRPLFLLTLLLVSLLVVIAESADIFSSSPSLSPTLVRRDARFPAQGLDALCREVGILPGGGFYSMPMRCTTDDDCRRPRCQCNRMFDSYHVDGARLSIIYGYRGFGLDDVYGVGVCGIPPNPMGWRIGGRSLERLAPSPLAPSRVRKSTAYTIPKQCMTEVPLGDDLLAACCKDGDCPNSTQLCQCNGRRSEDLGNGGLYSLVYGYQSKANQLNKSYGQGFWGGTIPRGWRSGSREISLQLRNLPRSDAAPAPLPSQFTSSLSTASSPDVSPPISLAKRTGNIPKQCMNPLVLPTDQVVMFPVACWDDEDCVRERRGNPYKCYCNGGYDEDLGASIRFGYNSLGYGLHPHPYGVGLCGAYMMKGRPIG